MKNTLLQIDAFGAITFTIYAVAAFATLVRLYTRVLVIRGRVGLDDWLAAIATVGGLPVAILGHLSAKSYIHIVNTFRAGLPPSGPTMTRSWDLGYKYGIIIEMVYVLVLPVAKCSVVAFFCRIKSIGGSPRWLYLFMVCLAIQGIICFAFTIAAYDPPEAIMGMATYNQTHPGRFRWRYEVTMIQLVNTCFQLVFDLIILAIPLPFLLKLKLKLDKKVALLVLYALSFVSVAVTVVRLVQIHEFRVLDHTENVDFQGVIISREYYLLWSIMEVLTVLFVANLPSLYALYKRVQERAEVQGTAPYFIFTSIGNPFRGAPVELVNADGAKGSRENGLNPEMEKRLEESIAYLETSGGSGSQPSSSGKAQNSA